jgi:hypothetical protein
MTRGEAGVQPLINMAPELKLSDRYMMVDGSPTEQVGDIPLFPAIALPVETKLEFECPSDHLDCLRTYLGNVTKVLTVGWAAQEQHFLKLLKDTLTQEIYIHAVARREQDATDVLERFKAAGIPVKEGLAATGGFTEYAVNRELEKHLGA